MVAFHAKPLTGHEASAQVWQALASVADPEIPALSIVDLGMVRKVEASGSRIVVEIAPTYSGCPATEMIVSDVRAALERAGFQDASVELSLSPPWTSDWITPEGREKLRTAGIAPPAGSSPVRPLRFVAREPRCPHCGSAAVERLATFGSTACKALYRCRECREPFDYFKPY